MIAFRSGSQNYSPFLSGIIISSYYGGMLASVFTTPHFLKNVGHVRLFAALTALVSATILAFPLVVNPYAWIIFRLLIGFGYVGLFIITEAWINAMTTNDIRGRITSIYMIVQFLGFILGQLMLRGTTPESSTLFLVASIGVSIAVVPMLMVRVTNPPQPESGKTMPLRELYSLSPFAGIGTILVAMNQTVFYATLGYFAHFIGMDLKQLSVMTILVFVAAMISQWPMAWLSDRTDRRIVIMIGNVVACLVAFYALGIDYGNIKLVYYVIFGLALAIIPIYSINLAHAHDVVPVKKIVAVSSTMYLLTACGSILGPSLTSNLMSAFAAKGFFIFIIIGNGLLFAFALYRRMSRTVKIHYQSDVVPISNLQTQILDPTIPVKDQDFATWDISKNEAPDYQRFSITREMIDKFIEKVTPDLSDAVLRKPKKVAKQTAKVAPKSPAKPEAKQARKPQTKAAARKSTPVKPTAKKRASVKPKNKGKTK